MALRDGTVSNIEKSWHTTDISTNTKITSQCKNMIARKNTLPTPPPVFSPQSRDELTRAVEEAELDAVALMVPLGRRDEELGVVAARPPACERQPSADR